MKKKTALIVICLMVLVISIPLLIYILNRDGKKVYVEEETNITISRGEILVIEHARKVGLKEIIKKYEYPF